MEGPELCVIEVAADGFTSASIVDVFDDCVSNYDSIGNLTGRSACVYEMWKLENQIRCEYRPIYTLL
jgi:hypothetical protein